MDSKPPQDTESRHADKYIVRLPDGMRDRLKEAAKASSRTMNAEIVARLEQSFESKSRDSSFQRELELIVLSLTSKAEVLGLRTDMVMLKRENLEVRSEALLAEQARLTPGSLNTDADFERAEKLIAAMKSVQRDADAAAKELASLTKERGEVLKTLDATREALRARASAIEKGMADYLARNPDVDPFASYKQIEQARQSTVGLYSPILDNTPKGPKRSPNARTPVPKKAAK